jgi:hypothetical protein
VSFLDVFSAVLLSKEQCEHMELKIKTKQHWIKTEIQRRSKIIAGISAKQRRLFWLKIVFPAESKT